MYFQGTLGPIVVADLEKHGHPPLGVSEAVSEFDAGSGCVLPHRDDVDGRDYQRRRLHDNAFCFLSKYGHMGRSIEGGRTAFLHEDGLRSVKELSPKEVDPWDEASVWYSKPTVTPRIVFRNGGYSRKRDFVRPRGSSE